jgi:hypothetical protein
MKQMKISIDDTDKIEEALRAVNGTATKFTVTDAADVISLAVHADNILACAGIRDTDANGTIATYRPAGPWANAYKNSGISTLVAIKKSGGSWYLTDVKRVDVYPRNPERYTVIATPKAAVAAATRMLKSIGRSDITVSAPETITAVAA